MPGRGTKPPAAKFPGLVRGALDQLDRPAIAIVPQGVRDGDSDPEYLDRAPARNWETALSRELPAYVDSHFRTIPNRNGRAVVGVSAGGYGAMLIGLHHLDTFSVIQSWSGYHRPTDPAGLRTLDLGSHKELSAADVPHLFRLYPGGHERSLWTSHALEWLGLALGP